MSFSDIRGQDKAINIIKEALSNKRFAASYLFIGPEGVGKNLTARTLAKAINCEKETSDSCDTCISCQKIEKNQYADLHLMGNAAEYDEALSDAIKIEAVRLAQKEINLKPYEGRKKVFIIDNAHNLTAEAANALLKTLEEPPKDTLIILITAKPALLFKTIISRCQIVKFSALPRQQLEEVLKIDYQAGPGEAHFLSFFCEGRLGQALKLKATDLFRQKNRLLDEFSATTGYASGLSEQKDDLRSYLNILASWLRDLYLLKTGAAHNQLINLDRKDQLLKLMHRYSFTDLEEALNYVSDSISYLEQNVNAKLLLANLRCYLKG